MSFSDQQLSAIVTVERTCSVLSLAGTAIVISTFIGSHSFRKPINRLVFYASWGNIMANVATLIARSGILLGDNTALCAFQGFLVQWFMPADALWTFAMAFNVYLTFFHKYDAARLRSLEWKYVLLCYGIPFIPSFVYFFVRTEAKGPIYGSAVLWCWVSTPWDILRIAVFYGPVWFVIAVTFAIYIRAGKDIFMKRKQLQNFSSSADAGFSVDNPFEIHASKVIHVTSENSAMVAREDPSTQVGSEGNLGSKRASGGGHTVYNSYSVTVERGDVIPMNTMKPGEKPVVSSTPRRSPRVETNAAAFAYCKYAMLYFVALLVTWVPSTVNRVYGLAHPDIPNFGLEFTSALVLPLQGFWNSLIYIAISWSTIKELARASKKRRPYKTNSPTFKRGGARGHGVGNTRLDSLESLGDNESTREFARPQTERSDSV